MNDGADPGDPRRAPSGAEAAYQLRPMVMLKPEPVRP